MKRYDQFVVVYQGSSRIPTAINLQHVRRVSATSNGDFGIHMKDMTEPMKIKQENCCELLEAVGLASPTKSKKAR